MSDTQAKCARDRHWFDPGHKRILALDGGGVRGAIEVAFLEKIEETLLGIRPKLAQRSADDTSRPKVPPQPSDPNRPVNENPACIGDYFDLIGGTSTGAVIAGALALGYGAEDLKNYYLKLAPRVFTPRWYLKGLRSKFDATALSEEIASVVTNLKLESEDLRTGLCVVAKRMDTGSPWIVANNPHAPYWNDKPAPNGHVGNRHYKLAELVRASTAAPYYFEPQDILVVEGERQGTFVDGGVTPHNNPALILFLMTILKAYGIGWRTGLNNLTIVSIGTGRQRQRVIPDELGIALNLKLAINALTSLMIDTQEFVLMLMQFLGKSVTDPVELNSEIKTIEGDEPQSGKQFRYLRYDLELKPSWIEEHLGVKMNAIDVARLSAMDDPSIIDELYALAKKAAEKQVKPEHFDGI